MRSKSDEPGAHFEHGSIEQFEDRLEFEMLLSDLSSRFINLSSAEVDHEIEDALCRVCEFLGLDLAVLWQWSVEDPGVIMPTHFYPAEAASQQPEPLHQELFPWVVRQMLAGRVVSFSSMEELPAEAAVDRASALLSGIKSNLTLPLSIGGAPAVGALAFNTTLAERDWPDSMVNRLEMVANIFTNALARRRHEVRLEESEERLALAIDSAGAGVWTLDFKTEDFWATDRGREIFGYLPEEAISVERFEASVHPDDRDLVREAMRRSAQEGEPINLEYRIIVPGHGGLRWIASRGRARFSTTGKPERLMGVSIDISERKRGDEALRSSEARLATGAELAGLAFYEVDFGEGTMFVDDRIRDLCGVPPGLKEDLQVLEFWLEHLHPDDRRYVLDLRDQMHDGTVDRLSLEYRYLHPDRGELWMHHLAGASTRDVDGRAIRTFGVFRDITERKRVETELRDLSRRLIRAQEEERALLARELHDDVTQRLAVLAIDVGRAEGDASDDAQSTVMRSIREGLVRISEDIHSLAYQLHPSVLEELGLAEALRAECERRSRQSGLEFSVELDSISAVVGKDAELCLFRVAQEALNNLIRHASASTVGVTLKSMDGGLLLAVTDDGVGFDRKNRRKNRSLGLASMRERVQLVNGTLDIESAPGRGTEVIAWVPAEGEPR